MRARSARDARPSSDQSRLKVVGMGGPVHRKLSKAGSRSNLGKDIEPLGSPRSRQVGPDQISTSAQTGLCKDIELNMTMAVLRQ